jgi:hypothetical protein
VLGVLICLAGFFVFGGRPAPDTSAPTGYGYGAAAAASANLAPMFNWPQLLMLSFGGTLIVVGIVSLVRDSK